MSTEKNQRDLALEAIKEVNKIVWDVSIETAKQNGQSFIPKVAGKWAHVGFLTSTVHIAKELADGKNLKAALNGCIPELGKEVVTSLAGNLASNASKYILALGSFGTRVVGNAVTMILTPTTMGDGEYRREPFELPQDHFLLNLQNTSLSQQKPSMSQVSQTQQSETKQRLNQIYASKQNSQAKATEVMGHIKALHKDMVAQKIERERQHRQAKSLADFQGISDGFGMLAQIGTQTGSKGLQVFGTAAGAITQGVRGFAQLTGTMGMAAMTGASMITPITAIVGGLMTLSSLFRRGRNKQQAKAFKKMFKQLSSQISNLHKDMRNGLEIINKNMQKGFETTNQNLYEGFKVIDENVQKGFVSVDQHMQKGFELLSKQIFKGFESIIVNQEGICHLLTDGYQALDYKLDDQSIELFKMAKQLQEISQQSQEISLKFDFQESKDMSRRVERFNPEYSKPKALKKILQLIRDQIRLSANDLKALDVKGNKLSGWFYIQSLENLFMLNDFQKYNVDLSNVMNIDWAESALDGYIKIMPHIAHENYKQDSIIQNFNQQILREFKQFAKPTADFVRVVSSQDFQKNFFKYYERQLSKIRNKAEMLLNPIRKHYSKNGMQEYARDLISKNENKSGIHLNAIVGSITDNSWSMTMQVSNENLQELALLVNEYNQCVTSFKLQINILFDVLQVEQEKAHSIKLKLAQIKPIKETYYRSKGIKSIEDSSISQKPTYYYIDMPTDNQFGTVKVLSGDIANIQEGGIEYAEATAEYLDYVNMFGKCSLSNDSNEINNKNFDNRDKKAHLNVQMEKYKILNSQKIFQLKSLETLNKQLEQLKGKRAQYQEAIDEVNNSTEYVKIGELKTHIAAKTQSKEISVPTGATHEEQQGTYTVQDGEIKIPVGRTLAAKSQVVKNDKFSRLTRWRRLQEQKGLIVQRKAYGRKKFYYAAYQQNYKTEPNMVTMPLMVNVADYEIETIQEPLPGGCIYQISYPTTFPVDYKVINDKGLTLQAGSENKDAGYHATAVYKLGEGCDIHLEIKTLRKYSKTGRNLVEDYQSAQTKVDYDISTTLRKIELAKESLTQTTLAIAKVQAAMKISQNPGTNPYGLYNSKQSLGEEQRQKKDEEEVLTCDSVASLNSMKKG